MKVKAFNVKNHKLDSASQLVLNRFMTDNYCGVVSTEHKNKFFTTVTSSVGDTTTVKVKTVLSTDSFDVIADGILFSVDLSDVLPIVSSENYDTFYYLKINRSLSSETSNIYSDEVVATLESKKYTDIDKSYTNINGAPVETYTDDSILFTKFTISGTDNNTPNNTPWSHTYNGTTIVEGDYLIIPLFAIDSAGGVVSIISVECKSSLEDWLSGQALSDLWEKLHKTFTHQSGSSVGELHYGKIGNIIIGSDGTISTVNQETKDDGTVVTTVVAPVAVINQDDGTIKLYNYTDGALYTANKNVSCGNLPVANGGTGASTKTGAKENFGIYYGEQDAAPYMRNKSIKPAEGDIYFKILT